MQEQDNNQLTYPPEQITDNLELESATKMENRNNFDSHEHLLALEIIAKLVHRNYSRHFIKRLMFNFIESLRKSQTVVARTVKPVREINWPFRDLFLKKNRTEEENQLFQFANLCAEMIQAKFKAFKTRKRHLIAYQKAVKAQDVLRSFVRRFKAYRTYNCEKVVEIRTKIRQIQKEIDQQQENYTSRDAKKLKGLYKYLQIYNKMFKETFYLLMETGMWTLEKNMKPKIQKKQYSKPKTRQPQPVSREVIRKKYEPDVPKALPKNESKKQNIDHNISNQFSNNNSLKIEQIGALEDRPIKAAGEYKISEQDIVENYTSQKLKKERSDQEGAETEPNEKERVKKVQELKKRTKYDPRKAIEQEKNRKKNQVEQKKQQKVKELPLTAENKEKTGQEVQQKSQILENNSSIVQQKQKIKPTKEKKESKRPAEKVEKTDGDHSNLKQLKITKKVSSKVDCWGNKKEPEPQWVKDYKSRIMENRNDSQQKNIEKMRRSIEKNVSLGLKKEQKIKIPIKLEEEQKEGRIEKRYRLKSDQDQRERVNAQSSFKEKHQEIENLRQRRDEIMGQRKNSSHNLQEQVRAMLEKKNNLANLKRKEVHRPIEQLEETYSKHYGDRYQNLLPKLSLLAVARSQQRQSKIPIASGDEDDQEWFEPIYHSTQYWKIISQQDRIFKSFILS